VVSGNAYQALRLIIYQPQAHYRVPFTYQRRHTYPLPSYSAVRGLLCNILGIRGCTFGEDPENNKDFQRLKGLKIGICGRFEAKTTECTWLRNLSKTEHIKTFGVVENRVRFGVGEHPGGQSPVLVDVLNEVRIVVYLAHEDPSFLEKLSQKIQNPVGRLYPLYLGRAEDWMVVEDIKIVLLEVTSKDAHFEHFFWVPEKPGPLIYRLILKKYRVCATGFPSSGSYGMGVGISATFPQSSTMENSRGYPSFLMLLLGRKGFRCSWRVWRE
jgi:CRISPR-associated protein Cas5t